MFWLNPAINVVDIFCVKKTYFLPYFWSHLEEEDITFAPAYRYERHTYERYVYTKAKATGVSP